MKKQFISSIDWDEQFMMRTRRNASIKHETTKLLLVLSLKEKYKKDLYWVRIYTEYSIGDKITDVYFENLRTNEIICYEIQKDVSDYWLEKTKNFYNLFERYLFTTDWVLIEEEKLPDNLEKLNEQIKEIIL